MEDNATEFVSESGAKGAYIYHTHTRLTFLSNLTNFNQVLELMPGILDHASIHSEMNIENVFFLINSSYRPNVGFLR